MDWYLASPVFIPSNRISSGEGRRVLHGLRESAEAFERFENTYTQKEEELYIIRQYFAADEYI